MRIILYGRVSLADGSQTTDNQMAELDRWLGNQGDGTRLIERITDQASTRDRRPGHERALLLLRTKQADTLVFWSLDRWGRDMAQLVTEIDEAIRCGWTVISLREGFSIDTAIGRFYVHMLGAMAEFERSRIRERTMAGLARARSQGKHIGRPTKAMLAARQLRAVK